MATITPMGTPGRPARRPTRVIELPALKPARLLDRLRERLRGLHYSLRTEELYVRWCKEFIRFLGLRHPAEMGAAEVEAFWTALAADRQLAPSTHYQALSALLFLYGGVLQVELPWLQEIGRPAVRRRLPVVLSPGEVKNFLDALTDEHRLLGRLLYGTGMRLSEALRLRMKDVDFAHQALIVRAGKGDKDRVVMLPQSLRAAPQAQLRLAHAVRAADAQHRAGVELPHALERSSRVRASPGPGSGCSRKTITAPTRAAVSSAANFCATRPFSAASSALWQRQASTSPPRRTRCGTALPRFCCRRAMTSVRCRSCLATRMWPRP